MRSHQGEWTENMQSTQRYLNKQTKSKIIFEIIKPQILREFQKILKKLANFFLLLNSYFFNNIKLCKIFKNKKKNPQFANINSHITNKLSHNLICRFNRPTEIQFSKNWH